MTTSDITHQLKDLYKTYNSVAKIQKLSREQGKGKWQDFSAELITRLSDLEAMPSDELIALAISEKYRKSTSGKDPEREKKIYTLSKETLDLCDWRDYKYTTVFEDTGKEFCKIVNRNSESGWDDKHNPQEETNPDDPEDDVQIIGDQTL